MVRNLLQALQRGIVGAGEKESVRTDITGDEAPFLQDLSVDYHHAIIAGDGLEQEP